MKRDDLDAPRGFAWAIAISTLAWIIVGGAIWSLLIHWRWRLH